MHIFIEKSSDFLKLRFCIATYLWQHAASFTACQPSWPLSASQGTCRRSTSFEDHLRRCNSPIPKGWGNLVGDGDALPVLTKLPGWGGGWGVWAEGGWIPIPKLDSPVSRSCAIFTPTQSLPLCSGRAVCPLQCANDHKFLSKSLKPVFDLKASLNQESWHSWTEIYGIRNSL